MEHTTNIQEHAPYGGGVPTEAETSHSAEARVPFRVTGPDEARPERRWPKMGRLLRRWGLWRTVAGVIAGILLLPIALMVAVIGVVPLFIALGVVWALPRSMHQERWKERRSELDQAYAGDEPQAHPHVGRDAAHMAAH